MCTSPPHESHSYSSCAITQYYSESCDDIFMATAGINRSIEL